MILPICHIGHGAKIRGRAVGPNSKSVPAQRRVATVTKVHLDYAYLQEEVLEDDDEFKQEAGSGLA